MIEADQATELPPSANAKEGVHPAPRRPADGAPSEGQSRRAEGPRSLKCSEPIRNKRPSTIITVTQP